MLSTNRYFFSGAFSTGVVVVVVVVSPGLADVVVVSPGLVDVVVVSPGLVVVVVVVSAGFAGSSFLAQPAATITEVANNKATKRVLSLRILNSPPSSLDSIPPFHKERIARPHNGWPALRLFTFLSTTLDLCFDRIEVFLQGLHFLL